MCDCPRCAMCSAHSDCTPVSGCQPHGPSVGDTGSREWMARAVGGFGDRRPDCAGMGNCLHPCRDPGTLVAGMDDVLVVLCDHGHSGALWLVRVLLLLSASHPLSSFSPPSLLPLAGPRRLRLGTQPGTVPLSSGALCLHQRPPAILCLPLGWRLRPRLLLECKASPIPPCSVGCHGAGGAAGAGCLSPPQRGHARKPDVPGGCPQWRWHSWGGQGCGAGCEGAECWHRQDAWLVPKQQWHVVLAELRAGSVR